jgi:hypothetical protein
MRVPETCRVAVGDCVPIPTVLLAVRRMVSTEPPPLFKTKSLSRLPDPNIMPVRCEPLRAAKIPVLRSR